MKKISAVLATALILFANSAWGFSAEPVSPGDRDGSAVTAQPCPTFSWSAGSESVAYRLEVYEMITDGMSREQMKGMALPVISRDISAPSFSWTPSSAECLSRGVNYVWYVQGLNDREEGYWSEGRFFEIEPYALAFGQKEAVQEVIKEYIETELSADADSSETETEGVKKVSTISEPMAGTEGNYNTLLGIYAGNSLINPDTGINYVTFIGSRAGLNNTTGYNNSFIGANAGHNNSGGFNNSFVGFSVGYSNTNGHSNIFIGAYAGYWNSSGYNNSFIGRSAGYNNTTGHSNSFIGRSAGYRNLSGSGNVFLGYEAGYNELGSEKLYISNSSTPSPLIYGEFDNQLLKINGTLLMASDERLKKHIEPLESSLDKIMRLKGVSYEWKASGGEKRGFGSDREIGLLAQNVEAVFPELVHTDSRGYKAVAYDKLAAVLIEAIKEQQNEMKEKEARMDKIAAIIEEKDAKLGRLTAMLEELSVRIAVMEQSSGNIASK